MQEKNKNQARRLSSLMTDYYCPPDVNRALRMSDENNFKALFLNKCNIEYCKSFCQGQGCVYLVNGECTHPDFKELNEKKEEL